MWMDKVWVWRLGFEISCGCDARGCGGEEEWSEVEPARLFCRRNSVRSKGLGG